MLKALMRQEGMGVAVFDAEDHLEELNATLEEFFQLERQDIQGRGARAVFMEWIGKRLDEPSKARLFESVGERGRGERVGPLEFCVVDGQGSGGDGKAMGGSVGAGRTEPVRTWCRYESVPIDTGEFAGGRLDTFVDITCEKESGKKLHEMAQFWESVIESANVWVDVLDPQGRVLVWNRAAEEISGYRREEVLGDTKVWELLYPEETYRREIVDKATAIVEKGERAEGLETVISCKGGDRRTMAWHSQAIRDDIGEPMGSVASGRAVSRQQGDLRPREESAQRRTLPSMAMENAAEAIIIANTDGKIQYVNPAFTRIMGYSAAEVEGRHVSILESEGAGAPDGHKEMWDTIRRGETWRGVFTNATKDGRTILLETTIAPVRDRRGDVVEYVAIERDVTRERALEKHLRSAQKMEAIGTLAGGIAHDFNNVIHVVSGYAQLALQRMEETEKLDKYLRMVLKACRRADKLVGQILSFSRQREQPFKPILLGRTVRETVRLLRATLPSHIEVVFEMDGAPGAPSDTVLADPTQIHQVVMNLCTNAYHSMQDGGGVLHVGVESVEIDDPLKHGTPNLKPGRHARLFVCDTGCGMSPWVLERIFEPYFTTKEKDKGTGLGLAVVHGIVRNHGGDLVVNSVVGKGTQFSVYLPAAECEITEEDLTPTLGDPAGRGQRVLCVDDERPALEVAREMLEELGYRVTTATGGSQALELFHAAPEEFDAVVTDKVMPQMGGVELARRIREERPDIPVLLCTGYLEAVPEEALEAAGLCGVLHKPFAADQLGCSLEEALLEKDPTPPSVSSRESQPDDEL